MPAHLAHLAMLNLAHLLSRPVLEATHAQVHSVTCQNVENFKVEKEKEEHSWKHLVHLVEVFSVWG